MKNKIAMPVKCFLYFHNLRVLKVFFCYICRMYYSSTLNKQYVPSCRYTIAISFSIKYINKGKPNTWSSEDAHSTYTQLVSSNAVVDLNLYIIKAKIPNHVNDIQRDISI